MTKQVLVQHIAPVSIEEAQEKALPILLAGFRRRGASRSEQERIHRAALKLARDDQHRQPPQICTL